MGVVMTYSDSASELPLIMTPEMQSPLYSGHSDWPPEMQSPLYTLIGSLGLEGTTVY